MCYDTMKHQYVCTDKKINTRHNLYDYSIIIEF